MTASEINAALHAAPVYHQGNEQELVAYARARGRVPRDYTRRPYGATPGVAAFDLPLIPESEWRERFAAKDAAGAWLIDAFLRRGAESLGYHALDQDGLSLCWRYGVVSAIQLLRSARNEPFLDLVPESILGTEYDFRDHGGFGHDAAQAIAANGICTSRTWPHQSLARSNDNAASQAERKLHKIVRFLDLRRSDQGQLVSALLADAPVPVGLDKMGHEMCACRARFNPDLEIGMLNSWDVSYGVKGFAWFKWSYVVPCDLLAVLADSPGGA